MCIYVDVLWRNLKTKETKHKHIDKCFCKMTLLLIFYRYRFHYSTIQIILIQTFKPESVFSSLGVVPSSLASKFKPTKTHTINVDYVVTNLQIKLNLKVCDTEL